MYWDSSYDRDAFDKRSCHRHSVQVLQTPRHVSRTGSANTNPGNTPHAVRPPRDNSPVPIGGIGISPTSGHSGSLQVFNTPQSTVSDKIGDTQKLDTSVDINLPDDGVSTSIFSKVIVHELSHSSSSDLYLRCWMDFSSNIVQTKAPHFVELGLPAVITLDEVKIFKNPATRIRRFTGGSHWSAPDHVLGEATAVRMSATSPEQDYSHKTDFQIWRENQDFGRQNNPMSLPPLDMTIIGTNTTNGTTLQLDSISIEKEYQNLCHEHDQWRHQHDQQSCQNNQQNIQSEREKCTCQRTQNQTHHRQNHHQASLICWMIEITANPKSRNAIKIKSV